MHIPSSNAARFDLTAGVTRHQLDNGLTVLLREIHDKPIVSSIIWYRVGSRNEEAGQTGKSHFLEHMLFKGTKHFAKGEIDQITLCEGGSNNAFTDTDFTAYYFNFASDRWQSALEIEASRMVDNRFDPPEFAAEKEVVIEELRISLDTPSEALDQGVWAAAFWQHPYRHPVIGWLDDLERLTLDQLHEYYRFWYHPRNANLVIAGDFDTDRTLSRIEELFGGIAAGPQPLPMLQTEAEQRGERRIVVKRSAEIERLEIAFHAPQVAHPDSPVLQIVAALLGEGKTSRLYQRLIERDQSAIQQSVEYTERIDPGLFIIRIDVKAERSLRDVERSALEEIDRLKAANVSEAELARAKRIVRSQFILGNEEIANQAISLGLYQTISHLEYLSEFIPRIEQVTAEDVRLVAERYFSEDHRIVGYLVAEKVSGE